MVLQSLILSSSTAVFAWSACDSTTSQTAGLISLKPKMNSSPHFLPTHPYTCKVSSSLAPKADEGTKIGREAANADSFRKFLLLGRLEDLIGIQKYWAKGIFLVNYDCSFEEHFHLMLDFDM